MAMVAMTTYSAGSPGGFCVCSENEIAHERRACCIYIGKNPSCRNFEGYVRATHGIGATLMHTYAAKDACPDDCKLEYD